MGLSLPHVLLLAGVAALLLGGGRFSALMGDVAKGVKEFKSGMAEKEADPAIASPRLPHQPAEMEVAPLPSPKSTETLRN